MLKSVYTLVKTKDLYSSLAQSVERMTVNHDVAGSSPAGGAKNKIPYCPSLSPDGLPTEER